MIRLLHTADLHADRERAGSIVIALARIGESAQSESADAVIVAGDIWNHAVMNTENSRFSEILTAFRRLADVAPVFMIYGTPTHDAHGSLEVFETLDAKHPIRILRPGQPVEHAGAIFFGVPEPSLRWLVPEADTTQVAQAALRAALSSHMIGIGAKRRAFPGPAVLVYHGQVSGSRLSNGEILEGGTGIMASVDDLKATGCDYIAMGDIHQPQRVGEGVGIVAEYPGSLPPQNFGEEHTAGFNLLTIDGGDVSVRRIELPEFPARRTIRVNWVGGRPDVTVTPEMVSGFMVKLEISCDRTDVPMIDETELMRKLRAAGAADGSVIAIKARPVETVRFAEIAEKDSPEEKLALWFEQSGKPITDEIRLKHRQVAAEVSGEGGGPRPGHIELTRLVLRGAIGLKDMSGLDEIDWNLDDYPDGLVALIGSNGSGKTTMVENFHPWPQLLTREGTIKSNFFLKDSMRDLYWTDHRDGSKYRSKILINGVTESADPKYFLYRFEGGNWEPIGDVEGRVRGYEEEINRLFGSLDLFLKSAFVTQSPPNGIAQIDKAKRTDRMVLFSALCGLEFWELYKVKAKFHKDTADRKAELLDAELKVLEGGLADPAILAENKVNAESEVSTIAAELTNLETSGKQKFDEAASLKSMAAAQIVVRDQLTASETRVSELHGREADAKRVLNADDIALASAPAAEAALRDLEGWEAAKREQDAAWEAWRRNHDDEERGIGELRKAHETEQKTKSDAYRVELGTWETELRRLQGIDTNRRLDLETAQREAQSTRQAIELRKERLSAPEVTECDKCGQELHTHEAKEKFNSTRRMDEEQVKSLEAQLETYRQRIETLSPLADTAKNAVAGYEATKPIAPPFVLFEEPARTVQPWNDSTRAELVRKIAAVNVAQLRYNVQAAAVARDQKATHEKALADVQADLAAELKRAEDLRVGLDTAVLQRADEAEAEYQRLRNAYAEAKGRHGAAVEKVAAAVRAIEERDRKASELAGRKDELAKIQAESGVWESMRYAYSDKGVQALELDALAPSISSTANALLEIFGSVFRIEFQTTRISGSGKDAKQVEDLLIQVMNQETGKSREISLLSGGERVWVLRALYDAFGLIRSKNSDVRFLTAVQDEADGALDVDARMAYLRMIEDAHRRSGRKKTIIVTHSEALQAMISTKIFVRELGPRKEGGV